MRLAVAVELFRYALRVAVALLAILPAVAVNVAEVDPAATATDAGTVSAALFEDSDTFAPPAGAEVDRLTLHVLVPPEVNVLGEHKTDESTRGASKLIFVVAVEPFSVAEIVAVPLAVTAAVDAVKVADAAPAETVEDAGTVSAGLLEASAMTLGPEEVFDSPTVHVVLAFEFRVEGWHCTLETSTGACKIKSSFAVLPLSVAVTVAAAFAVSVPVDAVKVTTFALLATVTDEGTRRFGSLEDKVTCVFDVTLALSVTVQLVLELEAKVVLVHWSEESVTAGCNLMLAVAVLAPKEAVTTALSLVVIVPAVAVKVAEVEPAETATDAGTLRRVLLEERPTLDPPAGAAVDRVTVQVLLPPEPSVAGLHPTEEIVRGAVKLIIAVAALAPRLAVIVLVAPEVIVPAVAENVVLVAFEGTDTDAGTIKLLLSDAIATDTALNTDALLSDTVQVELAFDASVAGTQVKDERLTGA